MCLGSNNNSLHVIAILYIHSQHKSQLTAWQNNSQREPDGDIGELKPFTMSLYLDQSVLRKINVDVQWHSVLV